MIKIFCVTDFDEAKHYWQDLSYHKRITDEWDIREAFYKYQKRDLKFYVAETSENPGEIIGLLPLQSNPVHGLEFFAEDISNYNSPFVRPGFENIIPNLYEQIHDKAQLYYIVGKDNFTTKLTICDYEYNLDLKGINSFDDFLNNRLSSKRRRSLQKEFAEIGKLSPKIILKSDASEDWSKYMQTLFKFNIKTHGDESYLNSEDEQKFYLDILQLNYKWRLAAVEIGGVVCAVSLSVLYDGNWSYLLTGVNFKTFPGLGKLLQKINIEQAIKEGATTFNAGMGNCNWKKLWHLDESPLYEFEYGF